MSVKEHTIEAKTFLKLQNKFEFFKSFHADFWWQCIAKCSNIYNNWRSAFFFCLFGVTIKFLNWNCVFAGAGCLFIYGFKHFRLSRRFRLPSACRSQYTLKNVNVNLVAVANDATTIVCAIHHLQWVQLVKRNIKSNGHLIFYQSW